MPSPPNRVAKSDFSQGSEPMRTRDTASIIRSTMTGPEDVDSRDFSSASNRTTPGRQIKKILRIF
jgi:hypothetical protein